MISDPDLATMQQAIYAVRDAADEADSIVAGLAWWTPSSTVAAAKSDAPATRNGLDAALGAYTRLAGDPNATHDDVVSFLASCSAYADLSALKATAQIADTGNMVSTVAGATASELGTDVRNAAAGAGWGLGIGIPVVLLALAWWFIGRRVR